MKALLRWLFAPLFYRAEWDVPGVYRFARRVGGVSRRGRGES